MKHGELSTSAVMAKKDDTFIKRLYCIISRARVEIWTFFMIGLKQQASMAALNALFSMVIPIGIIMMVRMMPIELTQEVAIVYISGNFITPMSNLCMSTLAQLLIGIRASNGFEHMATLPIYRASPLLGTLLSSAISVLPALFLVPVMGVWILKTSFAMSIWLVLVIVLSMLILICLGAIIGTCSERYHTSTTISMIAMFFVMFATPVYYPLDSLPTALQVLQRLLPFTYALEAMRSLMINPVLTPTVLRDIVVLFIFLIITVALAWRFFSWKQRS
jgi:ABC-2 type transport system permease protein